MNQLNKSIGSFILLGAMSIPVLAQQNTLLPTVQVYGILDLSAVAIDAGATNADASVRGNRQLLHSGSLQTSRLGFKASKDLGNGLTAVADLLAGPNPDTGNTGSAASTTTVSGEKATTSTLVRTFNLGASLGLASHSWGSVDAGYLRNPMIFVAFSTDLSGYGLANYAVTSQLQHHNIMRNGVGGFYENTIRYRTPVWDGFKAELTKSFGSESRAGQSQSNQAFNAFNVQYNKNKWYVGFGYSVFSTRPITTFTDDTKSRIIGGFYDFDFVKIGAHLINSDRPISAAVSSNQEARQISAKFRTLQRKLDIDIGYGDLKEAFSDQQPNKHSKGLTLGATYHLPQGVDLYMFKVVVSNNNVADRGLLFFGDPALIKGESTNAFGLGMRYAF